MTSRSPHDSDQWPANVGETRAVEAIDGKPMAFTIVDEILRPQSELPEKLLCFQRLVFEENGSYELRLGYYMLGARGYWVWGQYSTMIPAQDMAALVEEATSRGWFEAS